MNMGMKKLLAIGIAFIVIGGIVTFITPKEKSIEVKAVSNKIVEKEEKSEEKSAFKGMEVYIFDDNGSEKYLLKHGTNYKPSREELLGFNGWTENFDDVLGEISEYEKDTYVFIFYDKSIEKESVMNIEDKISKSLDSENISIMESSSLEDIGEINIEIESVKPE
ncbi:MAG: hypothetical protein N4A76_01560 [Firmicutes bacterium]|jgi:hypothetical protein|nr:hypothetical protein [Bacillota bacterium]